MIIIAGALVARGLGAADGAEGGEVCFLGHFLLARRGSPLRGASLAWLLLRWYSQACKIVNLPVILLSEVGDAMPSLKQVKGQVLLHIA